MKLSRKILWLLLAPTLLVSCWDYNDYLDINTIVVEPIHQTWVLPLVNSTVTFREVLESAQSNTIVDIDESTGVFYMAFRDTLAFASAEEEFYLHGTQFPGNIAVPLVSGFGQIEFEQKYTQNYTIVDDAEIKRIDFSSGSFFLEMKNNYNHTLKGVLTIKSLSNDEGTYTRNFNLQPFSSTESSRDLNNFSLDLFDTETGTYNSFVYEIEMTIEENLLAGSYDGGLDLMLAFNSPDFELIQGKIDKTVNLPQQQFSIGVFSTTTFANQHFAQPYFGLTVYNGYGVPIGINFSEFAFYNEVTNELFNVQNIGVMGPGDLDVMGTNQINYVEVPSDHTATTLLEMHENNSNLADAFDNAPNFLRIEAALNLGDDSHERFIRRSSDVSFITDMVLPIIGWAETHEITDTLSFGGEGEDSESLLNFGDNLPFTIGDDLSATLKFKLTNELPLDIYLQIESLIDVEGVLTPDYYFFVDEQTGNPEPKLLAKSATLNSEGVAVDPQGTSLLVEVDRETYDRLNTAEHILLKYRLVTGGGGQTDVKVLATNTLKVQLSLIVSGTIQVDPIDLKQ